jgi:hypothetical protein
MSTDFVTRVEASYAERISSVKDKLRQAKRAQRRIPDDIPAVKRRCIMSIRNDDVYRSRRELEDVISESINVRRLVAPVTRRPLPPKTPVCGGLVSLEECDRAREFLNMLSKEQLVQHILDFKCNVLDRVSGTELKQVVMDGYDVNTMCRSIERETDGHEGDEGDTDLDD